MKMKIEVEVSKETYELGVGLGEFAVAVKAALKDGWQMGEDLPDVITAAVTKLVPAVEGVDQVDDELKADPAAFARAVTVSMSDVLVEFLKKDEEPAEDANADSEAPAE